jgi:hypothetical protein
VAANGSFAGWPGVCAAGTGAALGPDEWVRQMGHLGLTVDQMSGVTAAALVNGTADTAIPGLVACAVSAGYSGYFYDLETFSTSDKSCDAQKPTSCSEQQAVLYASWLGRLAVAMHAAGKTVSVALSDWGILQYYHHFAAAKLDTLMTMATYYNMNQSSADCSLCPAPIQRWDNRETLWKFWLKKPQADGVAPGVMSAGVGQMVAGGCGCRNGTTKSCCAPGGGFDYPPIGSHGLTDKLAAARAYGGCHGFGCPGQVWRLFSLARRCPLRLPV